MKGRKRIRREMLRKQARIDTKYGDTFVQMREQMGMISKDFGQYISAGALSRFENYETLPDIRKLKEMMQVMHSSLGEYERFCDNFEQNPYEAGYQRIAWARYRGDKDELRSIHLLMVNLGPAFRRGALAAKASYQSLTEQEAEECYEHLFGVDMWMINEIYFAGFVVEQLPKSLILSLLKDFFERRFLTRYQGSTKYTREIYNFASRAGHILVRDGSEEEVMKLVEQMELYLPGENELYTRMDFHFLKGLAIYRFIDREAGQNKIQEIMDVLGSLGSYTLQSFYLRRFEETVGHPFGKISD
ncbi:Rgg family transcriptional regulator [Lactococcus termiticola]|uniref:XRE family transcriptional regulator n=1 Tax=Lactococcus termiticola TaxID=2169526 RepID=A0A2R5HHR1_9LACT|nr:hypothetical protein [Lactococcus termiticola]GBG96895.1 XRE family transcriptional regulator [Lactococcus termiticola]